MAITDVLNGQKRYITNAPEADLFLVMARTDPEIAGAAGVSAFIVEADTPGIAIGPVDAKMGQAGAPTSAVEFTDCRVPAEVLVGGRVGEGFKTAMRGINHARLHVAATCVGQATRLIEEALGYAVGRVQFDRPIVEFQSVQNMLVDSRVESYAARAMILDTAERFDQGEDVVADIACCKYFASEMGSAGRRSSGAGPGRRRLHQGQRGGAALPRRPPVPPGSRASRRSSAPSSPAT